MQSLSLQWGSEALWHQLEPLLPGISVEVVPSTSSTNTDLLDRARVMKDAEIDGGNVVIRRSVESGSFGRRAADIQPSLLVAEHQTQGRGRHGRGWESAPGASLTFSLGLTLAVSDWSGLSLAVGVALAEVLGSAAGRHTHRVTPVRVGLKWPNDLWLVDGEANDDTAADGVGRKLGGVLIETVAAGARRLVVVGVGVNVLPFNVDGLDTGFACARELDPQMTAPRLLAEIALPLVQALKQFEAEGFAAFSARFDALDLLRGRAVRTVRGEAMEGTGAGVSEHGALLLQTKEGLQSISSGEISVRLGRSPGRPC